jgi:hypothetical protein
MRAISDMELGIRDGGLAARVLKPQIRNPKFKMRLYSHRRDLAGFARDPVLYLARHECGTKICREKGIEFARRLLGHANISTTQRCMHLDDRELADAQDLVE